MADNNIGTDVNVLRKRKLAISVFDSTTDLGEIESQASTWDDLTAFLADRPPKAVLKKELRLMKLAKFGNTRNPNGEHSYRHNGNVLHLSGIIADYDGEQVSVDEAEKRLAAAGVSSFLYTSPSHTKEKPRWRVLTPLSVDMPPNEHGNLVDKLNGALGGILAGESWTLTQIMYYGRLHKGEYETRRIRGRPLDLVEGITPIGKKGVLAEAPRGERTAAEIAPSAELDELRRLLVAKDFSHQAEPDWWVDLARIHHETSHSDEGLALAIELSEPGWNANGTSTFASCADEVEAKWQQIGGRNAANPATAGSLRREAVATTEDFGPPVDQDLLAQAEAKERATQVAEFLWVTPSAIAKQPHIDWTVRDVLPRAELNMLYGPSGAGKSAIALDMMLAVARGTPWRGYKVKPGVVGWLAAEAFLSMRNRLLAYCKHHGIEIASLDDVFKVLDTRVSLMDSARIKLLAQSAASLNPSVIVLDTFAAATPGANENAGEDVGIALDNCRVIYDITGASVLMIHHSGKDEAKGARGHSSIKARVQAELEAKKRAGSDTIRDLTIDKQRDGEEGLVLPFTLKVLPIDMDEDGDIVKSVAVEHIDPRSALEQSNARKKGQGKWHRAIREALLDAPGMRLDGNALLKVATTKVPEGQRTSDPRKQLRATINEMVDVVSELRVVGGFYEFAAQPVAANPDAPEPGFTEEEIL